MRICFLSCTLLPRLECAHHLPVSRRRPHTRRPVAHAVAATGGGDRHLRCFGATLPTTLYMHSIALPTRSGSTITTVDLDGTLFGAWVRLVEDVHRLGVGLVANNLRLPRTKAAIAVLDLLVGGDGRDSRGRRIAARVDTAVSDGWVAGGGRGLHCRAGTWRGQAARDASTPNRDRVRRRRSLLHNSLALPSPSVTPLLSNGGN